MAHIGDVIRYYRDQNGLSRKELITDLCSEKYLYLIEKGLRTPSSELVHLIGNRLGVPLFRYYDYLSYQDPVQVRKMMDRLSFFRRTSDFEGLKDQLDKAQAQPDFHKAPLTYELEANRLMYQMLAEGKVSETIEAIEAILPRIAHKYRHETFMAYFHLLLSVAYFQAGQVLDAHRVIDPALSIIENKEKIESYHHIIVLIRLHTMALQLEAQDYAQVLEAGQELERLMVRINRLERINFLYYYLALAYWHLGHKDLSVSWMEKCLHNILIQHDHLVVSMMMTLTPPDDFFDHVLTCEKQRKRLEAAYSELVVLFSKQSVIPSETRP